MEPTNWLPPPCRIGPVTVFCDRHSRLPSVVGLTPLHSVPGCPRAPPSPSASARLGPCSSFRCCLWFMPPPTPGGLRDFTGDHGRRYTTAQEHPAASRSLRRGHWAPGRSGGHCVGVNHPSDSFFVGCRVVPRSGNTRWGRGHPDTGLRRVRPEHHRRSRRANMPEVSDNHVGFVCCHRKRRRSRNGSEGGTEAVAEF